MESYGARVGSALRTRYVDTFGDQGLPNLAATAQPRFAVRRAAAWCFSQRGRMGLIAAVGMPAVIVWLDHNLEGVALFYFVLLLHGFQCKEKGATRQMAIFTGW